VVLGRLGLGLGDLALLDGSDGALALQADGGHQALDLRALGVLLAGALLALGLAAVRVDVLLHVILLGEVKQLADLARALGTTHARHLLVRQPGQLGITHLGDHQVEHGQVGRHDATADGLAAALAHATTMALEARRVAAHQQAHAVVGNHALLHRETLLVAAPGDLEHVPLELVAQRLARHLSREPLVVELTQLGLVIHLQLLLAPRLGVGDVQLHGCRGWACCHN